VKFGKSSRIFLVLGVVVIGAIMVYLICSQQVQQRKDLETQVIAAQKKLAQLKIDDLIARKDQLLQNKELYSTQIAAAQAKLAAPIDNITATDKILESAHTFNLKIASINCGGKSNNTFAGNKFIVLPFTLEIEGTIVNMAAFVSNIKTLFPTALVETYRFAIGTPTPTPSSALTSETEPGDEPNPIPIPLPPIDTTATINITIYDYKGDANVE
jgi:hypothetical protein